MFENIKYDDMFDCFRLITNGVTYSSEAFNPSVVYVYTYIPYIAASRFIGKEVYSTSLPTKKQLALHKLKYTNRTYRYRLEGIVDALIDRRDDKFAQCDIICNIESFN